MPKTCPHKDVQFCPLYVAMHLASAIKLSCNDGRLGEGSCAVVRKMDYDTAIAKLEAHQPGLVAERRFAEEAAEAKEQRNRNMRLLGLH